LTIRVLAELKITPNEQSPLGYANTKLSSADGSRTLCLDFLFCKKSITPCSLLQHQYRSVLV